MGLFGREKANQTKEMEQEKTLKQNLEGKAERQSLFFIQLLFEQKDPRPDSETVRKALEAFGGDVDIAADVDQSLSSFALKKYMVEYSNGEQALAQVMLADFQDFHPDAFDDLQRSQFWDCPDWKEVFQNTKHQLMISDFMASGLDYKERCGMFSDWLETALQLFPSCTAVWVPSSGKLLKREQVLNNPCEGAERFLYYGVNARFFNIQGTEDMVVDTLGLYAIDLPDVQYHFHGLDPNAVVNHAYNAASYLFAENAPIQSGETIDGISEKGIDRDVQWVCQYERSLIQPERGVMDICPGEFAAGERD